MTVINTSDCAKKLSSGSFLYQYLATFTGCLTIIATGMHFGWPSPSLPQLLGEDSHIPMTDDEGSWLATMPCIGGITGSLLAAYLVDITGRKVCLLITSPLYLVSWIIVAYSPSIIYLDIARFLAGVSDGLAFTALPMYLCEISDSKIRGMLCTTLTITTVFGFLLINIVGSYLSITQTALVSSIVPVIHFASFIFMPESPYYFILINNMEKARESLKIFKGMEDVSGELHRLEVVVKEDLGNAGKIWDLFTISSNRKAFVIIVGLRGIQQLSGTNAITFYAKIIFQETDDYLSPTLATIIYFLVQVIFSIICSILVDKLGRKPLLIFSIIGSGFTLALEGLYFYFESNTNMNMANLNFLPLLALFGYVIVFNLGMGTIPLLILGELFPTSVKAFALCLADIYFGLVVIVVSKFFQFMKDNFGMHVPFFAFSFCCMVGLVFIILCIPETKGKTLEEIQEQLKGKTCKNIDR